MKLESTPDPARGDVSRADPTLRPLPLAALGLAVGIALADACGLVPAPASWTRLIPAFGVLLCGAVVVRLAVTLRRPGLGSLFVALAFLVAGAARVVSLPVPAAGASGVATISGVVVRGAMDLPAEFRRTDATTALLLDSVAIDTGAGKRTIDGLLRIESRAPPRFVPRGAIVEATVRLRAPRPARNPGDPGEARRFASSGIVAAGVVEHEDALAIRPGASPLARMFAANDRLRRVLVHAFAAALPADSAGLAAALVLGVRDGLDPEFTGAVAGAGTIHLLAISGMQVAWLVVLVRGLLGLWMRPAACNAAVVVFALGYADLAGAEAPVLRAGIAAALVGIGRFLGRPARALDALAAAAIVLLLSEPGQLFRPGFQLSFAACYALLTRAPAFPPKQGALRRAAFAMRESLRWSIRATVATAPIVAYHFGTIAPLSPLLTLVLTPPFLAAFLSSVTLLPLAIVLPEPVVGFLAMPAGACLEFAAWAFAVTAELPLASLSCLPLDPAAALVALAGLELARRRELPARTRIAALAGATLLFLAIELARGRPPSSLRVVVLDVGHGQAVIVRARSGANLLLDCGAAGASPARDGDRAARITLDACRALGVRSFDLAFLSHGDADHRNGLERLVRRGFVDRLVLPLGLDDAVARRIRALARDAGIETLVAARGDVFTDEPPTLRVRALFPDAAALDLSENDRSLVLALDAFRDPGDRRSRRPRPTATPSCAGGSFLQTDSNAERTEGDGNGAERRGGSAERAATAAIGAEPDVAGTLVFPGDLETPGIDRLLALEREWNAAAILLPHHGRDEPGLAPFVYFVRAPIWIASRGRLSGATLAARLAARHDATLLSTADSGAIEVTIDAGGGVSVAGYRSERSGFERLETVTSRRR